MQTKDLTTGKIGQALFKLVLPLTIANIVNIAYNMIDMFYIGKVGDEALSAVGTAGLFIWLGQSVVFFSKQGMETLLSQSIGSRNTNESRNIIKTGVVINVVITLIYSLIVFLLAPLLISLFNLSSDVIVELSIIYLRIGSFALIFMMINMNLMSIFQARGQTNEVLIYNGLGLLVNIILDPLLIVNMQMGVGGAAIATLIANIVVFILAVFSLIRYNKRNKGSSYFVRKIGQDILQISIPTGLYNVIFTIIAMIVSTYCIKFGDNVIAAQRIGSQIESLSWMMSGGLGIAVGVFTGQNFGGKNKQRIDRGYKLMFRFSTIYGLFLVFFLIGFAEQLIGIFTDDMQIIAIGTTYLYFLSVSQIFTLYEGIATGLFNGYGMTKIPSFFSISGNILRLLLVVVLSSTWGLNGIWFAISFSGCYRGFGLIVCKLYFDKQNKLVIN